ncbi:MAG TPA: zinc ribbon domain-containing protein [Pyrinomonadaceae bacterium]|nr:zinc ribbon domain-containing protein [Pyrinomonadaceae bacterium]
MYCSNCGTPLVQGLSYCNRCGADLRERKESSNTAAISAMLTAITLIGIGGLGVMVFGALVMRRLDPALIGVFMLFTFLIVTLTEFMLFRNLSKLTSAQESKKYFPAPPLMNNEMRLPAAGTLGEPVPSVTENTTRTLEYVRREH